LTKEERKTGKRAARRVNSLTVRKLGELKKRVPLSRGKSTKHHEELRKKRKKGRILTKNTKKKKTKNCPARPGSTEKGIFNPNPPPA